jgi:hypothetical protein
VRAPPEHLLADPQHRLLLRLARDPARQEGRAIRASRLPLDAAVVPGLLLLIARDLLSYDPPRVLAWRMLHDDRLAPAAWLLPSLPAGVDRDPLAVTLAVLASLLAAWYFVACARGAPPRARATLIAGAAVVLVVLPTVAFIAMGAATGRPYGQDGGVVQLPLAIDRILAGSTPYGADYSATILGRQARVSDFWSEHGGNPILHHHAYLPGTHLLMLPAYVIGRAAGLFDPRMVTLLALVAAALLAVRLVAGPQRALIAAAVVVLNPLVYWQQIFGANDVLIVCLLLGVVALSESGRPLAAAAVLGLACATKQLAWPFAPFLFLHLSGAASWRDLVAGPARRPLLRAVGVASVVFAVVVLPVALLDPRAFWGDIVVYNAGLPGGDNYPLGGTPGFGFANFIIYAGAVASLRDHVSFTPFYLMLIPVGLLLAVRQMRERTAAAALLNGCTALLLSLYFSRVVHPNYLILAATLLPIALLMGARIRADVVVVPLLLLAVAVEVAQGAVFAAIWQDAVAVRLPAHLAGLSRVLAPRAGPHLTQDPIGLVVSAVAAGLAIVLLTAGVLGARRRVRLALVGVAVVLVVIVPTLVAARVASASGVYRAQDRWAVSLRGSEAPPAMQAWSTSFKRDPPQELTTSAFAGPAILRESRLLTLLMIPIVAFLVVGLVSPEIRPLVLGVALLAPPIVVGTAFGSGVIAVLAAVLGAWHAWLRDRRAVAALLAALAVTITLPGVSAQSMGLPIVLAALAALAANLFQDRFQGSMRSHSRSALEPNRPKTSSAS